MHEDKYEKRYDWKVPATTWATVSHWAGYLETSKISAFEFQVSELYKQSVKVVELQWQTHKPWPPSLPSSVDICIAILWIASIVYRKSIHDLTKYRPRASLNNKTLGKEVNWKAFSLIANWASKATENP